MSRGGRGGRGRGRGGLSSGLNHGNMPFEIDPDLQAHLENLHKDQGLFPELLVPKPTRLDNALRQTVKDYRELQIRFRHGPYYRTGPHIAHRGGIMKERKNRSVFNAFEDNPSYLKQRAERAREFMEAEFDRLPWCRQMFPQELWQTIGAAKGPSYRPNIGRLNSRMDVGKKLDKMGGHADEEQERKEMLQQENDDDSVKQEDGEDEEGQRKRRDDEHDAESVEFDDTFEDAEDDMAGDYNAEQYFDGGDEDGDDGNDGGGGGGGGEDW